MDLDAYFARRDTPMANSPVGVRMQSLLAKDPGLSFAEARIRAGGSEPVTSTDTTWTLEEEAAFAKIMGAGHLERLAAIRLYKRCGKDLEKALRIAGEVYRPRAEHGAASRARLKGRPGKSGKVLTGP